MDLKETRKRNRNRLRRHYPIAFDALSAILFEEDPLSINFGFNADEYYPEAEAILPRIENCRTVNDVREIIYEEFQRISDWPAVGPVESYDRIAKRVFCELPNWFEYAGSSAWSSRSPMTVSHPAAGAKTTSTRTLN